MKKLDQILSTAQIDETSSSRSLLEAFFNQSLQEMYYA